MDGEEESRWMGWAVKKVVEMWGLWYSLQLACIQEEDHTVRRRRFGEVRQGL